MNITLHDNDKWLDFAPLTLTRPIGNLRMGILTNDERWKLLIPTAEIGFSTEDYLHGKFPNLGGIKVNSCFIPTRNLSEKVLALKEEEELFNEHGWIARRGAGTRSVKCDLELVFLEERWDLFQRNGEVIKLDFELITKGRISQPISTSNTLLGDQNLIFLEEGAKVEASILNTNDGPIYIGKNAEIMEGSIVRGPLAMNEGSALKLGTKIYGPTTLGPHCKVGGEVNNSIFHGYSNKGHDGFLGNSLIGEWCNLGADTNTSNLKNNYGLVKTFSYRSKQEEQTNLQFMGLTMGDHSKCGINTMFNTASVVGVSSNVYGADFPSKHIPSFQWGIDGDRYDFEKAVESSNNMMIRRGVSLSETEIDILRYISDNSTGFTGNK